MMCALWQSDLYHKSTKDFTRVSCKHSHKASTPINHTMWPLQDRPSGLKKTSVP